MSKRPIDATRQGGEAVGPKRMVGAAPVGAVEAVNYVEENVRWRTVRARSHQVEAALADALSVAIMCQRGDWRVCDAYPWTGCCVARLRVMGAK